MSTESAAMTTRKAVPPAGAWHHDDECEGEEVPTEDGIPHLADRLNALFDRVPDANGTLYNNVSAARELTDAGAAVSPSYLGQLRAGKKDNPTAKLLNAIAKLFGVPVTYFLDGDGQHAEEIQKQIDLLILIRDARVQGLATRMAGMSDRSVASIEALISQLRHIEGLDREKDEEQPDA